MKRTCDYGELYETSHLEYIDSRDTAISQEHYLVIRSSHVQRILRTSMYNMHQRQGEMRNREESYLIINNRNGVHDGYDEGRITIS